MRDQASIVLRGAEVVVKASRWVQRRLRPDHAAIARVAWQNDQGSRSRVYVNVACAPARSRRWLIDVEEVRKWSLEIFGGRLSLAADYVTPDAVARFIGPGQPNSFDAAQLQVWPIGLVEVTHPVPHQESDDGLRLPLTSIAEVISSMVAEVRAGVFRRIFRGRRRRTCRLDWFVSCSSGIRLNSQHLPLSRFVFQAESPSSMPAGREIREVSRGVRVLNCRQTTVPAKILRLAIGQLLRQTGHHGYEVSLEEVIRLVRNQEPP